MLVLLGVAPGWAAAQSPPRTAAPSVSATTTTAFVDVAVVPMDRERVLPHQTVLVREGRIVALGPTRRVAVPRGAARIDGRGKFLIPGLADMHAHVGYPPDPEESFVGDPTSLARRQLFLYLANGVTTIRVMQGPPEALALRAEAARGTRLSPRLYVAAETAVTQWQPNPGVTLTNAQLDSLVRYVEAAKRAGYDLFKIYGESGVMLDSVVATARRVGLPLAGHPPEYYVDSTGGVDNDRSIAAAIAAGMTSVEHLLSLELTEHNEAQIRANGLKLKRAGVWVCPTLGHMTGLDYVATYPELRYLEPMRRSLGDGMREDYAQETLVRTVKLLHDLGVGLLLGTDPFGEVVGRGAIWGFSVHRELAALVASGLRPYDALVTGTRNPAAYFGALDSTGTVAVGKRADLVLLGGNPLVDIRHTAQPAGVMLGGRWLPRGELDQILALLERTFP